ncbi:hypothetical protein KSP39_PZI001019 [Platanthera zijinensis]|uniref:Uncharacterized protein n=1 Tax=Platanthera zijinensis TaxID=2320716 RepID=A0AAP0GF51_9ASPA
MSTFHLILLGRLLRSRALFLEMRDFLCRKLSEIPQSRSRNLFLTGGWTLKSSALPALGCISWKLSKGGNKWQ